MNRIRLFTSGALFIFSIFCAIWRPTLPFEFPLWVYIIVTIYFAFFPIKDMISSFNNTSYKGRQFAKSYIANTELDEKQFEKEKKINNKRAAISMAFWLAFMSVPATLYFCQIIGREWIFFFFCLSNFSVFFAVFFWCPFHKIFIKQECCNECRIYNWDSFFQYSFLVFIPNIFTIILFALGVLSLVKWEIAYALHPNDFLNQAIVI